MRRSPYSEYDGSVKALQVYDIGGAFAVIRFIEQKSVRDAEYILVHFDIVTDNKWTSGHRIGLNAFLLTEPVLYLDSVLSNDAWKSYYSDLLKI